MRSGQINIVGRIKKVLAFEKVDRLAMIEWAFWWDQTIQRWHNEGLDTKWKYTGGLDVNLIESCEIREHLGLDSYYQFWMTPRAATCPAPKTHGGALMENADDYAKLKEHLFPQTGFHRENFAQWLPRHEKGELAIWGWIEGFFWFPRTLFGIEPHMYAFYDYPELMHQINSDLLEYYSKVIEELYKFCQPSFILIAEDLSYNHGPMLSKQCFDEFLAPYYRKIVSVFRQHNITPMVDSDGDVTECISWFKEVGVEGIGPLERVAGTDVNQIRRDHPDFLLIGGFDKTIMHKGEQAIREEFERLLPVMKQGGYLISVDHQTPPEVSLTQYMQYVDLLREYCTKAAQ